MMASSTQKQHDVYVNYRGADVRRGFLSHLSKALAEHNIKPFVDTELQRGEDITEPLFSAIENSAIAVVIFSPNYASSERCLDELVKIVECRNRSAQTVIPVYYHVDPTDVVDLRGSYGDVFAQHRDEPFVQRRLHALTDISMLCGLCSYNYSFDSHLIEEIVECIRERLKPSEPSPSASGSISTSPAIFKKKHEVFISFRGADVRDGFLSHLTKALKQHGVDVFVDKSMKRGVKIEESLLEIIEGSYISVVILSKQFANSVYCMKELVKILECKERNAQIVILVFYGIDPDHVEEVANSFEDAIAQGRPIFQGMEERWCQSLRETVDIAGFVSGHFESDSDLVDGVTQGVLEELYRLLSSNSCYDDGFVGIDSRVKNVMSLLDQQDVHIVGICGLKGIGKTTIARATFHQIRNGFESCFFVENVREKSERGVDILRNEILAQYIGVENHKTGDPVMMPSSLIRQKLSLKKFLLVLDDVSDFNQIKFILGNGVRYGPGSKIIVTSRDRHLLNYISSVIYEVEKLDPDESLQHFCVHAFKQKTPPEGYSELCKRAIAYAKGLPLELEDLGYKLSQRSIDEWEAELERLKDMSSGKTQRFLTIMKDLAKFTGSYLFVLLAFLLWKKKIMLFFLKNKKIMLYLCKKVVLYFRKQVT